MTHGYGEKSVQSVRTTHPRQDRNIIRYGTIILYVPIIAGEVLGYEWSTSTLAALCATLTTSHLG